MNTVLFISGISLSAIASGALTLAYCRAKSSDLVEAHMARKEAIAQISKDYLEVLSKLNLARRATKNFVHENDAAINRALAAQAKLDAIHAATVGLKSGTAIKIARMSGTTPERAAIRAKAADMATSMGMTEAAQVLS